MNDNYGSLDSGENENEAFFAEEEPKVESENAEFFEDHTKVLTEMEQERLMKISRNNREKEIEKKEMEIAEMQQKTRKKLEKINELKIMAESEGVKNWPKCLPVLELNFSIIKGFKKTFLFIYYVTIFAVPVLLAYNFLCCIFVLCIKTDALTVWERFKCAGASLVCLLFLIPGHFLIFYSYYISLKRYNFVNYLLSLIIGLAPIFVSIIGTVGLYDYGLAGFYVTVIYKKQPFPFFPLLISSLLWVVSLLFFICSYIYVLICFFDDQAKSKRFGNQEE